MIDKRILNALESPDSNIRKKAITALAKSHDADALPLLANVYRHDLDPELRDLARKAGGYLKTHLEDNPPAQPKKSGEMDVESIIAAAKSARQAEEKAREPVKKIPKPLAVDLDTLKVSGQNVERAKGEMDKAMYFSVQGDIPQAKIALQKAFNLNPHLRVDGYSRSMVLQVMGGVDEDQSLYDLLTEEVQLPKKESGGGGRLFALIMLIAGGLMLAGFFLPWMDDPLSADFATTDTEVESEESAPAYSGFDIVQNKDDIAVALSQLEMVSDMMRGTAPNLSMERSPTSFAPALVAVAGGFQILLGLIAFLSGGKGWYWLQGILMAVAGALGLGWLYLTLNDFVGILNSVFAGILEFNVMELLGMGFMLSAGGAALLVLAAVFGLLTSGGKD
jgi:hypothetical protein